MTPTWLKGGSDSSHTRQGGPQILLLLVTMVLKIFGIQDREIKRENRLPGFFPGISINNQNKLFSATVFSIPKVVHP
jgi:hypothetical protein